MKKIITLLLICISTTFTYAQRNIAGIWEGKLNSGGISLRIVFHFEQQSNAGYTGKMDSPDQGVKGIPCDNVTIKGDSIIVEVKRGAGLKGVIINDSTITSYWEQGGKKISMTMGKSKTLDVINQTVPSISTKNIAGIWEGKLDAGSIALRINFHFDKQKDNSYSGTMDSPDQGIAGFPCEQVILTGDSLVVQLKKGVKVAGALTTDTGIIGYWKQGGKSLPISLKRVKELSKNPNRPQTPVPPFNYNSEDVEYDNADKTVHFGATFTYPKGKGPFATAILITGSGQQDRDETILGHKSFAVIADYLTKKGMAVLRVDDRGMGKSTGDLQNATSADFANDVETGLNYLKGRKEADQKKMGMIGHSEGGLIASIVAARDHDIDFVIMLAGPGVKGSEVLIKQNDDFLKSVGLPDDAIAAYAVLYKKAMDDVVSENDAAAANTKLTNDYKIWKAGQSTSILDALKIGSDSNGDKKIVSDFVIGFSSAWIKYYITTDPQPLIEKFTCKVLALDGSKDIQVNAAINLATINKALKKSKSPSFETKELPGLNHLFQHCKKCTMEEYSEIEETFAPEALEIMGKWLQKNVM